MIVYDSGRLYSGWNNLTRVHGSAAYKAVLPALFSTGILLIYEYAPNLNNYDNDNNQKVVQHPYSIGAFIAFFSFLLTFRLNFAYGRYWEGATSVHQMMSKWLDCAMCLCAFHYQSNQFNDIVPPTFAKIDPNVTADRIIGRDRGFKGLTREETIRNLRENLVEQEQQQQQQIEEHQEIQTKKRFWKRNNKRKMYNRDVSISHLKEPKGKSINSAHPKQAIHICASNSSEEDSIPIPVRFQEQFFNSKRQQQSSSSNRNEGLNKQIRTKRLTKTRRAKVPVPSLFLQETAHLVSLLCAVALSTLRNDIDQAASPVTPYVPGKPWPCVDPDELDVEVKREYGEDNAFWRWIYFSFGLSRSKKRRTLYNAVRPFGVLGGVSDTEIALLQKARGPYAKVSLCTMWLQEFISREYLAGSTGNVAPPILSRLYQFISDGVLGYNQARRVAYIPFPFPHAQVTSFFSLSIIFIFPILFWSFVTQIWFACIMNYLTVLCFLGLHEVARELENPFQNAPNDLPLTTFQAQMNEALVTMYAGFHPDSWWEVAPLGEMTDVEEDD